MALLIGRLVRRAVNSKASLLQMVKMFGLGEGFPLHARFMPK